MSPSCFIGKGADFSRSRRIMSGIVKVHKLSLNIQHRTDKLYGQRKNGGKIMVFS